LLQLPSFTCFTYVILDFPSLYTRLNKNAGPLVGKGPSVSILLVLHPTLRTDPSPETRTQTIQMNIFLDVLLLL